MSDQSISQSRFRGEVLLSALLLMAMTNYFPNTHKTWFVEESGNIHIAPTFGLVIGVGLLMQKQWARKAGLVAGFVLAIISFFMMASMPGKPGYAVMLLCSGLLLYLLRPNHS